MSNDGSGQYNVMLMYNEQCDLLFICTFGEQMPISCLKCLFK